MRSRSYLARWAAIWSLLTCAAWPIERPAEAEDQLKCATVLAFLQNTHWLEQSAAGAPLTIGVVGRAAFFRGLTATIDAKSVEGRRLRVVQLTAPVEAGCCQMVYFATDKPAEIKPVLQTFSSAHTLTIGETDSFLDAGGAVNLFLADGHMAFEVSLASLNRAGIEISSKLLRFGQIRDLPRGRPAR